MKKRSREINVFSMSALDLFASAMGAFMLLALVYLVFFTMTSRSSAALDAPEPPSPPDPVVCPEIPDIPEPVVCPVIPDTQPLEDALAACQADHAQEGERAAACAAANAELSERIDHLEFPHVDLVVALDVTGSMTGPLEGLKTEIDQLMDVMSKLAPSFAMGVIAFGDRRWRTPVFQQDLLEVKHSPGNRQTLKHMVAGLETNMGAGRGGNPDPPEAVLAALNAAAASSWRATSERQIIVVVTDNPAYASERAQALDAARRFASGGGGRGVSTVFVNTGDRGFWRSTSAPEFLHNLAKAGQGQFIEDGGSMTANLLLALL